MSDLDGDPDDTPVLRVRDQTPHQGSIDLHDLRGEALQD